MFNYSISAHGVNGRIHSDAIISEFQRRGIIVPPTLTEITTNGIRYSHQDFDVLSSAMHTLETKGIEVWQRLAV